MIEAAMIMVITVIKLGRHTKCISGGRERVIGQAMRTIIYM